MFHLTQILVPLIVGGQQRHSDDSIGEGGLGEAAPLVPHACAAWPQLCGRQQLRGQQAQLERGLALAGAVVLRLLVVEGLVRLGPGVEEGMQGSESTRLYFLTLLLVCSSDDSSLDSSSLLG